MTAADLPAIWRYEIPVDDQWHRFALSGEVCHVGSRQAGVVEFWALNSGGPYVGRLFRVFGTGQPLSDETGLTYVGTAVGGALVWHLMERNAPTVIALDGTN